MSYLQGLVPFNIQSTFEQGGQTYVLIPNVQDLQTTQTLGYQVSGQPGDPSSPNRYAVFPTNLLRGAQSQAQQGNLGSVPQQVASQPAPSYSPPPSSSPYTQPTPVGYAPPATETLSRTLSSAGGFAGPSKSYANTSGGQGLASAWDAFRKLVSHDIPNYVTQFDNLATRPIKT